MTPQVLHGGPKCCTAEGIDVSDVELSVERPAKTSMLPMMSFFVGFFSSSVSDVSTSRYGGITSLFQRLQHGIDQRRKLDY